jgi:cathepsin L
MRVAICLLLIGGALAALTEEQNQFLFSRYLEQHDKSYGHDEMAYRYNVFKTNLAQVEQHNEEYSQGQHSFYLGMNKFGDWTNDEYRTYINKFKRPTPGVEASHTIRPLLGLPDSVDWRTKGYVTPVKDQGQCVSCWAFSAVGGMEGAHMAAAGKLLSLSEQELVDCAANGQDNCDNGGWMTDGFTWAIQNGMESESDYPYTAQSLGKCHFTASKVVAKYSSYVNVTSGSESALQTASAAGVVSVAIDASSFWFQLYSGGVYDDSSCRNSLDDLDHGVTLVGYGHDTSSGKDFWEVKNSWGGSWGESGYIRMVRNKNNQCGIATCASYPIGSA